MGTIRTFHKGDLPFYLTTSLPNKFRDKYMIASFMKTKKHHYSRFLMIVCHVSFYETLKSLIDFNLLLDIEAKRLGV